MKKSELKKHIIEALTPQEADKVDSKYKEIYGGMLKGNKRKLMKYIDPESGRPNPDKVAYGRAIKLIQKESANLKEKELTAAEKRKKEDIIMSLKKQKGGKDKLEPADYAIATSRAKKLAEKEEKTLEEIDTIMEEDKIPVDKLEKKVKSILKKEGGAVGLKPLVDAAKELGASKKDLMGILKKMKDVKTHKDGDIIDVGGLNETGMDKAKKNMDMYKDKNRLTELIKAALMGPMNEKKKDHDGDGDIDSDDYMIARDKAIKKAKGKTNEAELPGGVLTKLNQEVKDIPTMAKALLSLYSQIKQKEKINFDSNASMKIVLTKLQDLASKAQTNESFDSLVKKVDKEKGYTKKEAEKVAGAIAAKKMKGAGKGPTAKQKARMKEEILKELRGNVNENFLSKISTKIKDKIKNLSIFDKLADKIVSKMSKEDIARFKSKFNLNEDKSAPSVEDIFDKVHSANPDKNVNEISKIEDEDSIAFKVAKLVKNLTGLNLLALGGAPLGAGIAMLMPFFPGGVIVGGLISLIASVIIHNISRKLVGAKSGDALVGE